MSDLIDRQAAIDALNEYFARIGKLKRRGLTKGEKAISLDTVGTIKTLPPIQPDIVRCKDCKYARLTYDGSCKYCDIWFPDEAEYMDGDYYCASAERKSNG